MKCPIRFNQDENCIKENCSWWVDGKCSIYVIAKCLLSVTNDVMDIRKTISVFHSDLME